MEAKDSSDNNTSPRHQVKEVLESDSSDCKSEASSYDSETFGQIIESGLLQLYIVGSSSEKTLVLYSNGHQHYEGYVELGNETTFSDITQAPTYIKILNDHQNELHLVEGLSTSRFSEAYHHMHEVAGFVVEELSKEKIVHRIEKASKEFCWIANEKASVFFELECEYTTDDFDDLAGVKVILANLIVRQVKLQLLYFNHSYYVALNDSENSEQPLHFSTFPNFIRAGPCIILRSYADMQLKKLLLWCSLKSTEEEPLKKIVSDNPTVGLEELDSVQILTLERESNASALHFHTTVAFHDWSYQGTIRLKSSPSLGTINSILPSLNSQVGQLTVAEDRQKDSIKFFTQRAKAIKSHLISCEGWLVQLIEKLRIASDWVGDTIRRWLEGDASQAFFEFQTYGEREWSSYSVVVANAVWKNNMTIVVFYFNTSYYVTLSSLEDSDNELLNFRFPNVATKGRGYIIKSEFSPEIMSTWPTLRKLLLWQTSSEDVDYHNSDDNELKEENLSESKQRPTDEIEAKKEEKILRAKAPHHIKPLGSNIGRLSVAVAPWEKNGFPKQ